MLGRASLGSSSQIGGSSGGDWQEEVYQKIKCMNEMYFHDLNELYQRMAPKLQQCKDVPQHMENEHVKKLSYLVVSLERHIMFLHTKKNEVQIHHKDMIDVSEKQITYILDVTRPGQLVYQLQQWKI